MLVDWMAQEAGKKFELFESYALTCTTERCDKTVILAKPQNYMNSSGFATRRLVDHHRVDLSKTLIVYDDLALPLGTIRIRRSGGSSGQKGMQSIIAALGTQDVPRLRIGILPEKPPVDYSEYVLERFARKERPILEEALDRSIAAIDTVLADGIEQAMSLYN
jgi:PTH1 family peptidyl-tRNA hydrolase